MIAVHCQACLALSKSSFTHITRHLWCSRAQFLVRENHISSTIHQHLFRLGWKRIAGVSTAQHQWARSMARFNQYERKVEIQTDEQRELRRMKPNQPPDPHLLKVSIIGAPNAGKSTLANQLIGWRFASVSKKVHTTRHNSVGVLSEGNTQIVFLDTPGLITNDKIRKHKLEKTLLTDPHSSLFEADLIIAVVDVALVWNRSKLDPDVLTALALHKEKKSVLVLNKVDLVKRKRDLLEISRLLSDSMVGGKPACHFIHVDENREKSKQSDILEKIRRKEEGLEAIQTETEDETPDQELLDGMEVPSKDGYTEPEWWQKYLKKLKSVKKITHGWRGWSKFDSIFMVSALDGDGVQEIKHYLLDSALPAPWLYNSSMITDMEPPEIVCVREKLLDHLPKEIPYQVKIVIKHWEVDEDNLLRGTIHLMCQRNRDMVHIIGPNGDTIRKIRQEVHQDLMNTFRRELFLKITALYRSDPEWS